MVEDERKSKQISGNAAGRGNDRHRLRSGGAGRSSREDATIENDPGSVSILCDYDTPPTQGGSIYILTLKVKDNASGAGNAGLEFKGAVSGDGTTIPSGNENADISVKDANGNVVSGGNVVINVAVQSIVMRGNAPEIEYLDDVFPKNPIMIYVPTSAKGYDAEPWTDYQLVYTDVDMDYLKGDVNEDKEVNIKDLQQGLFGSMIYFQFKNDTIIIFLSTFVACSIREDFSENSL